MAYKQRTLFLNEAELARKSEYSMQPKGIAVHNTGNNAPAINERNYMAGNNTWVGFHVVVDESEVIECVPFNRNMYHVGDGEIKNSGNRNYIGIEIARSTDYASDKYTRAEQNAVEYIGDVLKQYGWGVDKLRQHYDFNGKNCPHRIRDEGRWESFKKRVQAYMNGTTTPTEPSNPTPPTTGNDWGASLIGKKIGDETIDLARDEIGGLTWLRWTSDNNPIFPTIEDAINGTNADTVRLNTGDEIEYWGVIRTDKYTYLIYDRDNGNKGHVIYQNRTTVATYGVIL